MSINNAMANAMRKAYAAQGVTGTKVKATRHRQRKQRLVPFRTLPNDWEFTRFGRSYIKVCAAYSISIEDGKDAIFATHELVHPVARVDYELVGGN